MSVETIDSIFIETEDKVVEKLVLNPENDIVPKEPFPKGFEIIRPKLSLWSRFKPFVCNKVTGGLIAVGGIVGGYAFYRWYSTE